MYVCMYVCMETSVLGVPFPFGEFGRVPTAFADLFHPTYIHTYIHICIFYAFVAVNIFIQTYNLLNM